MNTYRPFAHNSAILSTAFFGILTSLPVSAQRNDSRDEFENVAERARQSAIRYGPADVEFLDAKARSKTQQQTVWRNLIPANGDRLVQDRLPLGPADVNTWINLGPTTNDYGVGTQTHGINSARGGPIVVHPTNPDILYVGYPSGGVWRTKNLHAPNPDDLGWVPITDNLPTAGSTGDIPIGGMEMDPLDPETLYIGLGDDDAWQGASPGAAGRGFCVTHNASFDAGPTWTCQMLGLATRTSNIVLSSNGDIILVGTNDGLFRSTNHGATFNKVTDGLPPAHDGVHSQIVRSIARFSDSNWILTYHDPESVPILHLSAIYYSTDGGASWTQSHLDSSVTSRFTVTDPGYLAIYRITVATSPASTTVGYGIFQTDNSVPGYGGNASAPLSHGLLKTTDAGQNWSYTGETTGCMVGSDQGWYNLPLYVLNSDINTVFTGHNTGTCRSRDGGLTWTTMTRGYGEPYFHPDTHFFAESKTGPLEVFVTTDGGLGIYPDPLGTPPGGHDETWAVTNRNKGLSTFEPYALGSSAATFPSESVCHNRITIGLQDNGTRFRNDNTSKFNEVLAGDGFATRIHPVDCNRMLGSIYNDQIQRSTNGGVNWLGATSGIITTGGTPFFTQLVTAPWNPDVVFTFTNRRVYKTINYADLWVEYGNIEPLLNSLSSAHAIRNVAVAANDDLAVAVWMACTPGVGAGNPPCVAGRGFVSYDDGQSWSEFGQLAQANSNRNYLGNVAFSSSNSRVLYQTSVAQIRVVDTGEQNWDHIWKSVDAGATWTPLDHDNGFPRATPVHFVYSSLQNSRVLYAGTDFGIYRSTNEGATWRRYGAGLPMVAVRDFWDAPDGSFQRIASYGRGVWELTPGRPIVSDVSPSSATLNAGEARQFSATISGDQDADAIDWTVNPASAGSINSNGMFIAANIDGNATIRATSQVDPTQSSTATVTIHSVAVTTISIAPSRIGSSSSLTWDGSGIAPGATVAFTATVTGAPPGVDWAASAGSVDGSGQYTSPSTPGLCSVTVKIHNDNAHTASASVKVELPRFSTTSSAVNGASMAEFAAAFANHDSKADLNKDGQFNDADVSLFLNNFGR